MRLRGCQGRRFLRQRTGCRSRAVDLRASRGHRADQQPHRAPAAPGGAVAQERLRLSRRRWLSFRRTRPDGGPNDAFAVALGLAVPSRGHRRPSIRTPGARARTRRVNGYLIWFRTLALSELTYPGVNERVNARERARGVGLVEWVVLGAAGVLVHARLAPDASNVAPGFCADADLWRYRRPCANRLTHEELPLPPWCAVPSRWHRGTRRRS